MSVINGYQGGERVSLYQQLLTNRNQQQTTPTQPSFEAALKEDTVSLSPQAKQIMETQQAAATTAAAPVANLAALTGTATPPADTNALFHIDANNKVTLTDAGRKMVSEVGDIGDYRPMRGVNLRHLTYAQSEETLSGKDLAFALQFRERSLKQDEIDKTNAAIEAKQQAAIKPEPKVAVELDPKWIEAGKKIPVGTQIQKLTENMLTTADGQQYQEYNPFIDRVTRFGDVVADSYLEQSNNVKEMKMSRLSNAHLKQEMEQWDLMTEAKEFFSKYMSQKYNLQLELDTI